MMSSVRGVEEKGVSLGGCLFSSSSFLSWCLGGRGKVVELQ